MDNNDAVAISGNIAAIARLHGVAIKVTMPIRSGGHIGTLVIEVTPKTSECRDNGPSLEDLQRWHSDPVNEELDTE